MGIAPPPFWPPPPPPPVGPPPPPPWPGLTCITEYAFFLAFQELYPMVEVDTFCLNAWTEYIYGPRPDDPGAWGAYKYIGGSSLVTGIPWLWEVNIWCVYCYIGPASEEGDPTPIEAFKINTVMGFNTARSAKYEPDDRKGQATRSMVLANWRDHTNILIQYNPADLP